VCPHSTARVDCIMRGASRWICRPYHRGTTLPRRLPFSPRDRCVAPDPSRSLASRRSWAVHQVRDWNRCGQSRISTRTCECCKTLHWVDSRRASPARPPRRPAFPVYNPTRNSRGEGLPGA
jgi:hypothetical protein